MVGPRPSHSNRRRWHALVEHYTPDGALGRLLLAGAAGSAGSLLVLLGIFGVTAFNFFLFFVGLLLAGLGLAAFVLTILVLWPVYLSLIGNIDSTRAYSRGQPMESSGETVGTDPMTVLQREYAAGNISREEFERRLDDLLAVEELSGSDEQTSHRRTDSDRTLETDRR